MFVNVKFVVDSVAWTE